MQGILLKSISLGAVGNLREVINGIKIMSIAAMRNTKSRLKRGTQDGAIMICSNKSPTYFNFTATAASRRRTAQQTQRQKYTFKVSKKIKGHMT